MLKLRSAVVSRACSNVTAKLDQSFVFMLLLDAKSSHDAGDIKSCANIIHQHLIEVDPVEQLFAYDGLSNFNRL